LAQSRCAEIEPVLLSAADDRDHLVACHLAEGGRIDDAAIAVA
jgi:hypothetical protein